MKFQKKTSHSNFQLALFVIPLLSLLAFRLSGFDGLYGQDAYEYFRYSKSLSSFINNGSSPGDYFWPIYYPLFGSILNLFISNTSVSLQLISALSLATSAVYIYKTILLVYNKNNYSFIYVFLFFLLSPFVFKMGVIIMSDMLAANFIVISSYYSIYYIKNEQVKSLYFALIFAIMAGMTRYPSLVVLAPFGIYLLYLLIKKRKHLIHLVPLGIIALILFIPHYYIRNEAPLLFLEHNALSKWTFINFFKNSFVTTDGITTYKMPNIVYVFFNVFHPRYLLIGALFVFILLIKKLTFKFQWIYLISILLYALFLAGVQSQNSRFLLLSFPLIIIVLFQSFIFIIHKINFVKIQYALITLVCFLQLFMCIKGITPILERNKFEKEIITQILPYQNNTLYSFDVDLALIGRDLNFTYYNLWTKKYDKFEDNALVLFHPTQFSKQWEGKNPMINWNSLQVKYKLKVLEEFPKGWKLYQIVPLK